jgi:hypothetical protein
MPFLIDGDNLLGTWPGRKRSDAERRALSFELQRFAAQARRRLVLVYDGSAPPGAHFGNEVQFSGPGRSADQLILDFLRNVDDRRGWVVITSDRSLGDQCRYLEARVERCDRFRKRLQAGSSEEKPEREDDVDYWLARFSGEEDDG